MNGAPERPRARAASLSTRARAILTVFAEAFPRSAHYRGGRKLRKAGWERIFPRIETDVEETESFLESVEELTDLGVISVKWRRFRDRSEVDALYLERPKELFALLGLSSPEQIRLHMLETLEEDSWQDRAVRDVRNYLRAILETRHPVPVESTTQLRDLATLLQVTEDDARSNPIRALSVRLYGDSKRLERLLPVADRVTRRATGRALSEALGLARSYPELSLGLCGWIRWADDTRDSGTTGRGTLWECRGEVLTLPVDTVSNISTIEPLRLAPRAGHPAAERRAPALLSVENKESFYTLAVRLRTGTLAPEFSAITYCGGHPHAAYLELLRIAYAAGFELFHFGDLDPDGILIFAEMFEELGGALSPFLMDDSTFDRYAGYGYRPSPTRIELLSTRRAALPTSIRPLADRVLSRGLGVEQEVIEVGPDT